VHRPRRLGIERELELTVPIELEAGLRELPVPSRGALVAACQVGGVGGNDTCIGGGGDDQATNCEQTASVP